MKVLIVGGRNAGDEIIVSESQYIKMDYKVHQVQITNSGYLNFGIPVGWDMCKAMDVLWDVYRKSLQEIGIKLEEIA